MSQREGMNKVAQINRGQLFAISHQGRVWEAAPNECMQFKSRPRAAFGSHIHN